jgi:hypothetical protein
MNFRHNLELRANYKSKPPGNQLFIPRGLIWLLDYLFGNACLGDIDSKFEQFTMNSRNSAERIIFAHGADEFANISANFRPS